MGGAPEGTLVLVDRIQVSLRAYRDGAPVIGALVAGSVGVALTGLFLALYLESALFLAMGTLMFPCVGFASGVQRATAVLTPTRLEVRCALQRGLSVSLAEVSSVRVELRERRVRGRAGGEFVTNRPALVVERIDGEVREIGQFLESEEAALRWLADRVRERVSPLREGSSRDVPVGLRAIAAREVEGGR